MSSSSLEALPTPTASGCSAAKTSPATFRETYQFLVPRRRAVKQTVELLLPLIGALAVAHDRGVIHRDVKPANIVLVAEGGGRLVPHPAAVESLANAAALKRARRANA